MKTFVRRIAASCIAMGLMLSACAEDTPAGGSGNGSPKPSASGTATKPDKGDFKVSFDKPKDKDYAEYEAFISEQVVEIVKGLNDSLALPRDITIKFTEIGEVNAYYDPEKVGVFYGYEMIGLIEEEMGRVKADASDEEFEIAVLGNVVGILIHEIGHAIIDVLELPVLGREEDAADSLAAVIQLDFIEDGVEFALATAEFWGSLAETSTSELDESAFADEHSLDAQRFYNGLCWIAGSNDDNFKLVEDSGYLPEERLERCPDEYDQAINSWLKVLDPYLKE